MIDAAPDRKPELSDEEFLEAAKELPWSKPDKAGVDDVWSPGITYYRQGNRSLRMENTGEFILHHLDDPLPEDLVRFGEGPGWNLRSVYLRADTPLDISDTDRVEALNTLSAQFQLLTRQEYTAQRVADEFEQFRHSLKSLQEEADPELAGLVEEVIHRAVSKTNPEQRVHLTEALEKLGVAWIEDYRYRGANQRVTTYQSETWRAQQRSRHVTDA